MMETNAGKRELIEAIQSKIAAEGSIPFDDYMSLCLYHETYGYYTSSKPKVGKEGDFYTSASVGTVMGELLAAYIIKGQWGKRVEAQALTQDVEVVEWGGGSGRLAKQFLDEIGIKSPKLYERIRYTCVEHSPYHRQLQQDMCETHLPHMRWLSEDQWLEESASSQAPVFLFSNELLDAFPVKRIVSRSGRWMELHVTVGEGGDWQEVEQPIDEELAAYLRKQPSIIGQEGQQSEVCLAGLRWYGRVAEALPTGSVLLSIDYGHRREELLSEHRMAGTLMCYYQHQGHSDPYLHIGEQDLTAHVNFSAYQEQGEASGLVTEAFMTQKEFMLEAGILKLLQNHASVDPFHPVARRNRAIRQLLLDDGMGQLFKVLIQSKK